MYDLPKPIKVTATRTPPKFQYLVSQTTGIHPYFTQFYSRRLRGSWMNFNWHELNHDEFLSWMTITLVTQARKDDMLDKLNILTKKWTDVNLTIQINGLEVSAESFVEGIKSNMSYWAEQKAEAKAHEVLEGVRDKMNEVEDLLDDVASELRRRVDTMLKS